MEETQQDPQVLEVSPPPTAPPDVPLLTPSLNQPPSEPSVTQSVVKVPWWKQPIGLPGWLQRFFSHPIVKLLIIFLICVELFRIAVGIGFAAFLTCFWSCAGGGGPWTPDILQVWILTLVGLILSYVIVFFVAIRFLHLRWWQILMVEILAPMLLLATIIVPNLVLSMQANNQIKMEKQEANTGLDSIVLGTPVFLAAEGEESSYYVRVPFTLTKAMSARAIVLLMQPDSFLYTPPRQLEEIKVGEMVDQYKTVNGVESFPCLWHEDPERGWQIVKDPASYSFTELWIDQKATLYDPYDYSPLGEQVILEPSEYTLQKIVQRMGCTLEEFQQFIPLNQIKIQEVAR